MKLARSPYSSSQKKARFGLAVATTRQPTTHSSTAMPYHTMPPPEKKDPIDLWHLKIIVSSFAVFFWH
jgi:hypothetical protein